MKYYQKKNYSHLKDFSSHINMSKNMCLQQLFKKFFVVIMYK